MSPFWSGVLSLLTCGISNIFENGSWDNLGNILNNGGNTANDLGNQNIGGNLVAKYTGSRLTDAEREANAWSAQREDLAWERQMEASNTAYQRQVNDMLAAGLNPMMAVSSGNGASVPSASTSGSVSPSGAGLNLGGILSAFLQSKMVDAEVALKQAQATKLESETTGIDIANEIRNLTKDAEVEAANLRNGLTRSNIKQIDMSLDEIDARIIHLRESAETEQSKRELNLASSILAKANANNVIALLPYQQQYMSASTDEKRQAALLAAAHAAYQNKLIDDGYIDAFISSAKSESGIMEDKASLQRIATAIRTGDYSNTNIKPDFTSGALRALSIVLDNFNPLASILK